MEQGVVSKAADEADKPEVARSPRRKVAFRGVLETVTGRVKVQVRNVSCTGAMVEGDPMPSPGRDVILIASGLDIVCSVVWSEGNRCGLHFDEPLTPGQVLELHRITPEAVRSEELKAAAEWYRAQGWLPNSVSSTFPGTPSRRAS